jgi:acyl-coenzyme A synthetase/AMP-(fatty) acid ligase
MFPGVLYGTETWWVTLGEERRLGVFENRALSIIFESKMDEVTEEWRRLHNEELNELYSSSNIIRMLKSRRKRCGVHVACKGKKRCTQDFGAKI